MSAVALVLDGLTRHKRQVPRKKGLMNENRTDAELLAATAADPLAFGQFYERHEKLVLAYMMRRVDQPEVAVDLAAETFAQALTAAGRFRPGPSPAAAWLLGIARNVLAMSRRRGRVEDAARRRLGMQPVAVVDEALERVAALFADDELQRLLEVLAPDQREAVVARVVDEHDYAEIAAGLRCSESVVRQRVSRGLARLRNEMEGRS